MSVPTVLMEQDAARVQLAAALARVAKGKSDALRLVWILPRSFSAFAFAYYATKTTCNGETNNAVDGCRRLSTDLSACRWRSPDRWANRSACRQAARARPRAWHPARRGRRGRGGC